MPKEFGTLSEAEASGAFCAWVPESRASEIAGWTDRGQRRVAGTETYALWVHAARESDGISVIDTLGDARSTRFEPDERVTLDYVDAFALGARRRTHALRLVRFSHIDGLHIWFWVRTDHRVAIPPDAIRVAVDPEHPNRKLVIVQGTFHVEWRFGWFPEQWTFVRAGYLVTTIG